MQHNVDNQLEYSFCMQSEGSTPKKAAHVLVVAFLRLILVQLRGAFFQRARAESCTFPKLDGGRGYDFPYLVDTGYDLP